MSTERDRLIAELHREILRMVQEAVRFHSAVAAQLGMHVTDLNFLGALRHAGPMSAGELATRLGLTTGAITRVIDRLTAAGYVGRVADPNDRRRVLIEPIPEALAKVGEAFEGMGAHFDASSAGMSPTELAFLLDFTRRSADFAHDEADRLRREGAPHATRRSRTSPPIKDKPPSSGDQTTPERP
jgi:DNA-binding MarR family transcriptional regulator